MNLGNVLQSRNVAANHEMSRQKEQIVWQDLLIENRDYSLICCDS